jgi:hypothetical protein
MTEVTGNSILFEFQTEEREDALYTSPYNASASVYINCATAAVPAIIKTDEEKHYFEVEVGV